MNNYKKNAGFTIIELMIALSILSVILVIGSTLMARIGSQYTKGVNIANLNNTNRNIVSDIAGTLQFTGETVQSCANDPTVNPLTCHTGKQTYTIGGRNASVYSFCIGRVRYSYVLDREMGTDQGLSDLKTPHVLWRDTMLNANSCTPANISADTVSASNSSGDGYDVVPTHMRLTHFRVVASTDPLQQGVYKVEVWMAYGDSDLVQNGGVAGAKNCTGGAGTAFCAISSINTTVIRRLKI